MGVPTVYFRINPDGYKPLKGKAVNVINNGTHLSLSWKRIVHLFL
jgi:hypothetical protein